MKTRTQRTQYIQGASWNKRNTKFKQDVDIVQVALDGEVRNMPDAYGHIFWFIRYKGELVGKMQEFYWDCLDVLERTPVNQLPKSVYTRNNFDLFRPVDHFDHLSAQEWIA